MIAKKYQGRSFHRTSPEAGNPREQVFAEAWAKEQHTPGSNQPALLDWLLHGDGMRTERGSATDREHEIAATVIQWLGSCVGRNWLEETLKKADAAEEKALERR